MTYPIFLRSNFEVFSPFISIEPLFKAIPFVSLPTSKFKRVDLPAPNILSQNLLSMYKLKTTFMNNFAKKKNTNFIFLNIQVSVILVKK